jgi:hypothetical protein
MERSDTDGKFMDDMIEQPNDILQRGRGIMPSHEELGELIRSLDDLDNYEAQLGREFEAIRTVKIQNCIAKRESTLLFRLFRYLTRTQK